MQTAPSELRVAVRVLEEALEDVDGRCELVRVSDLDLLSPPGGYDEVALSVLIPDGIVLTDDLLREMESADWTICVYQPNGTVTRVRPTRLRQALRQDD